MNRTAVAILMTLLTLALVARAAAVEAKGLKALQACCPQTQAPIVIPDNVLTGHGAIATPEGVAHF